jgi:hypothetical protein
MSPVLNWALNHRKTVLGGAAILLAVCLRDRLRPAARGQRAAARKQPVARHLPVSAASSCPPGGRFPALHAGAPPRTSLTEVQRIMAWQDQVMSEHPAVASVAGKLGRAETATDPAPVEMIETTIMLKPATSGRRHHQGLHHRRPLRQADEPAGLCARLSPAHREPHPHDQHRHPRPGRREDLRRQPRRPPSRRPSRSSGSSPASRAPPASRRPACRASLISRSPSAAPTSPAMD